MERTPFRTLALFALVWVLVTPLYGQVSCDAEFDCPPADDPCMVAPPRSVNGVCNNRFAGNGQLCNTGSGDGITYRCFDTSEFPNPPAERYQCLESVCGAGTCDDNNDCTDDICYNTPGGATCEFPPSQQDFLECSVGFDKGVCVKDAQGGVTCNTTDPCLRRGYGRINCCPDEVCENEGANWASMCPQALAFNPGHPCDPTGQDPPSTDGTLQAGECVDIEGTTQCAWKDGVPGSGQCGGIACEDGNDCTMNVCDPASGTCVGATIQQGPLCDGESEAAGKSCKANSTCARTNTQCFSDTTFTDSQCCNDASSLGLCPGGAGRCSNENLEGATCFPIIDGALSTTPGFCAIPGDEPPTFYEPTCVSPACAVPDPNDLGEDPLDPSDDGWMPKECDDGFECTEDRCDPVTGDCTAIPVENFTLCGNRGGMCFRAGTISSFCLPFAEPIEHTCDLAGVLEAAVGLGVRHTFACTAPTTVTLTTNLILEDGVELDGGDLLEIAAPGPGLLEVRGRPTSSGSVNRLTDIGLVGVEVINGSLGTLVLEGISLRAGGGIVNSSFASVEIVDSTVTGNAASGLRNSGTATVRNTTISNNTATAGGGIYNTGSLTIEDSIISGNTASLLGGGMYVSLPGVESEGEITVSITDTTITGNEASAEGGGIYAFERFPLGGPFAAGMVVTGGAISDNTSTNSGGGIYAEGDISVDGVTISNNTTGASGGGAILHAGGGAITIVASTLDGNGADGDGGAILSDGALTIRDTTVTESESGKTGGGVYMVAVPTSSLQIIGSTFHDNRAGTAGGGFLLDSNSVGVVTNSTMSANFAPAGGGFYVQGSAELTMVSTTVAENGGVANSDAMAIVGTATFRNTLVDGGCGSLTTGVVVSSGGNIQTPGSDCGLTGPTDLEVTDTGLGPLQDNGGPTETMAPLVGSPALNQIDPAECVDADGSPLVVDQIGTARPQEGFCEVGAVEVLP